LRGYEIERSRTRTGRKRGTPESCLGIQALDPVSVGAAACLLCIAGMVATILPARLATRADLLDALHAD